MSNLTDEEIIKLAKEAVERGNKLPESEKLILDSPKFTSFAVGLKDDGTPFTDEDTRRNNEILYEKDKE